MHHLGPTFVLPSILVLLWLLSSPRILSAHCSGVASGSRFSRERITWEQTGCVFNPAEIFSMLKGGQSLANASPGTCLRASFYARAPLAAPFTPYSIRSLTQRHFPPGLWKVACVTHS